MTAGGAGPGDIPASAPGGVTPVIETLVLVAGPREIAALRDFMAARNRAATVLPASDLARATEIIGGLGDGALPSARLVCFCTSVIVPGWCLDRFPGPSYNIHPGPPTYPGRYPESFAIYDGATRFGATCHEMTPRVDEGAIVAVDWFDVDPGWHRVDLANHGFHAAVGLLSRLGDALATAPDPLPRLDMAWSGRKTRLADFRRMATVTPDMPQAEFERRYRAFGVNAERDFTVTLHGRRFHLTEPERPVEGLSPLRSGVAMGPRS